MSELHELAEDVSSSPLYSRDLAPTTLAQRTWNQWHLASLWIGMSVCIPTYMLAAGFLSAGFSWTHVIGAILLGNVIVLVPMVLNGHAGTKYGIPLPVFLRASFGTAGAHLPTILRGLVACGWFGIQTWLGGAAIYQLILRLWPGIGDAPSLGLFLGINLGEAGCFLFFWLLNVFFIVKGTESIKWLETLSAPILILIGVALLAWGIVAGGGLGRVLDHSKNFSAAGSYAVRDDMGVNIRLVPILVDGRPKPLGGFRVASTKDGLAGGTEFIGDTAERVAVEGESVWIETRTPDGTKGPAVELRIKGPGEPAAAPDWLAFGALLTAMVGFWATLALNIPDFTRFARSQKDQLQGQAMGLPTTMTFYSFVGVAVTCAALIAIPRIVLIEQAPWDPIQLLSMFDSPAVIIFSMFFLAVATLTTNLAANVVAPANGFANLAPRRITFRAGGILTALIGILIMPWKLIATTQGYIFTWLVGYGALLGPIAGILIADYYIVRGTRLKLADLYKERGVFAGVRPMTILILLVSIAPNVPGFLMEGKFIDLKLEFWGDLYKFSWFVGFGTALALYSIYGKLTWRPPETT